MRANEILTEKWSKKYKSSINCSHPKGFSQKAHCAGKKKHNESVEMEMVCEDCGMCQTHGNLNEIAKGAKDSNGVTKCWPGKHAEGTKKGRNGGQVRNCVPNESQGVAEGSGGNWYIRVNGKILNDTKFKPVIFSSEDEARSYAMKLADKKRIPLSQIKLTKSWMDAPEQGVAETTGDKPFDNMMKNISKGTNKQKTADRKEQQKQTQQRARDAFGNMFGGGNPADKLKIREQGVAEAAKHGLYYNVNKRKAAGTSRDASSPKAPTPQAWKDAAKTAKTESLDELSRIMDLSGLMLTADEQFDIIENMVEAFALHHGVDAEQIWEDFESVDDAELLDESAAWHRSAGKSKKGGLNAKGVASYRAEHPGSKLQMAVTTKPSKLKPGSKAAKRRKSFCARMGGNKGPMKKPNGKPTRKALALRKWNC